MKIKMPTFKRSFFRTDLKWFFAIMTIIFAWLFLSLFFISQIVTPDLIKKLIENTVEKSIPEENYKEQYNDLLFNLSAGLENDISFFGGIKISKEEMLSSDFDSIKSLIAERLYQKFYLNKENPSKDLPPLLTYFLILSHEKNQAKIQEMLKITLILLIVALLGLLIFSFGFGKLISLGICGLIALFPFYFLGLYLESLDFSNIESWVYEIYFSLSPYNLMIQVAFYLSLGFIVLGIMGVLYKKFWYGNKKI